MEPRPESLANYLKPPIDEVAIAVQFPAIEGLSNEQLREFWKTIRGEYPFVESQPRLDAPLEPAEAGPVSFQIGFSNQIQNTRLWLISESDDFLIQVQDTRFIQNWRRRGTEYPHFEQVRNNFWSNFRKFREFLTGAGLADPNVQQVEVTYINWITELPIQRFLRPSSQAAISIGESVSEPDEQIWNASYTIPNGPVPAERLYAQAASAVRALSGEQGIQFTLLVRGADVEGINTSKAEDMINNARNLIVSAFTDLTTSEAHQIWERFN